MADPYGLTQSGIPPELQAEYRGLTRQQAIQEALLKQSMMPAGGVIDAGHFKVARSPLEGLGKVAQAYMARQGLNETDKKFADLGDRQRQLQSDAVQQYQRTAQDRTMSVPNVGAMTGSMDSQDVPRQDETVKGDPRKAIVELLLKPYVPAAMQQMAMGDYTRQRDQEYEAAQSAELRKALGVGQPTVTQGPPTAQVMPLPNTGQEGGPQTSFAGPRTDILAQLNSIKDPQEKAAALQAFQAQDMSQRGMQTTQLPANAAVTTALMPGKAAARLAPILTAQQKQEADLADKAAGRAETGALRRELAGQTDLTRRELAGQNEQLRRDLAAQAGQLRTDLADNKPTKAPPGYRFTADGNQEVIPGGPADAKAQAIAQRQADGSNDVDVSLGTLRDAYNRLETGGGITSTNKGALDNAGAALSSSAVGQMGGKIVGSKNQSARNDIAMARPGLLAALMKATGMSAKQMDSNAELKLWLSTATDPQLDVESNRKALDNIEKKYLKKSAEPSGGAGVPLGVDPKVWGAMTPEEKKLFQ